MLAPLFPQLEVLSLLGVGGMGMVYKARQRKLDRYVALKIIRPEAAADPAFAERFSREAKALARLNHSRIVSIHDFGEITAIPESGQSAIPALLRSAAMRSLQADAAFLHGPSVKRSRSD